MPTEKPILTFAVDPELLEQINDFRFDNRIETKSEAIRILIEKGLKESKKKVSEKEIRQYPNVFVTNSLMGAVKVLHINGEKIVHDNNICPRINRQLFSE